MNTAMMSFAALIIFVVVLVLPFVAFIMLTRCGDSNGRILGCFLAVSWVVLFILGMIGSPAVEKWMKENEVVPASGISSV